MAKTRRRSSRRRSGSNKDSCYYSVKARYDVFPSAYASGAIAKCRKNKGKKKQRAFKKKMKTLFATLLLVLCYACGSIKGQAYIDINENIDYEYNEDLRYRTRFKVGYKIYLGEKHTIKKKK